MLPKRNFCLVWKKNEVQLKSKLGTQVQCGNLHMMLMSKVTYTRTKVMQGQLEYLGICCCVGVFIMILMSKIVSDLIVLCYNIFFLDLKTYNFTDSHIILGGGGGEGTCIQRWTSCSSTKHRKIVVFQREVRTVRAVFRVSKTAKIKKKGMFFRVINTR